MADVATLGIKVNTKEVKDASGALDKFSGSARRAETATNKLGSVFGKLGGVLRSFGPTLAAMAAALSGGALVKAAAQAESLHKTLTLVRGSGALADKELKFLADTADRLGIDFESSTKAFVGLAAAAKGTVLEGQGARDIFTAVAQSMAALGKSSSDTEGALLALQQMISKGVVSAEEMRGQLGERLPGAFAAGERAFVAMGGKLGGFTKALEDGKIQASQFLPAFAKELEKMGGGAARVDTLQAAIGRLGNAFNELLTKAGTMLAPAFKAGIEFLTGAIQKLTSDLNRLVAAWQLVAEAVGGALQRFGSNPRVIAFMQKLATLSGSDTIYDAQGNDTTKPMQGPPQPGWFDQINAKLDAQVAKNKEMERLPGELPTFETAADAAKRVADDKAKQAAVAAASASKEKTNAYTQEVKSIKDRTQAMLVEAQTYGMEEVAAARFTATRELENAASAAKIAMSPTIRAQITAEAEAYALAAQKVKEAKEAMQRLDEVRSLASGQLSSFYQDMRGGASAVEALSNAVDRLGDRLLSLFEQKAWDALLGAQGTSGGGLLGGLFSGMLAGTTKAYPVGMPTAGIAAGGLVHGPGTGTSDSIAARLSRGEYVVNAKASARHRGILDRLNSRRFAQGGMVTPVRRASSGGGLVDIKVNNFMGNDARVTVKETPRPSGGVNLELEVRRMVRDELINDFSERGRGSRRLEEVYGLKARNR